jgi:hypothetical protein
MGTIKHVDPELTVETKEKLLLQVKRIKKLVRNSSTIIKKSPFIDMKVMSGKTGCLI